MVDIIITAGVGFLIGCIVGMCLIAIVIVGRDN